jgi:phosphate-selective porin
MSKIKLSIYALILVSILLLNLWPQMTPPIKIGQSDLSPGGYMDFRYTYTEEPKDTVSIPDSLDMVRAVFYLDGRVNSDVTARIQYDFTSATLLDMLVRLNHLPYTDWEITVGQFKVPFSVAGENLGTPLQDMIRGPFIYELGATTIPDRETGVMAKGEMLDKKGQYAFGVFNGNGINTPDDNDIKDRLIQFRIFPWKDDVRSPLKPMEFGAAWIVGEVSEPGIGVDTRDKYAFSVKYAVERLLITYEYFLQTLDVDGPDNINTKSWYLQLMSNESVDWLGGKKQTIQPVARYEFYDGDSTNPDDEVRVSTFGFNWQINNSLRLQVNFNDYNGKAKPCDKESLVQLGVKF